MKNKKALIESIRRNEMEKSATPETGGEKKVKSDEEDKLIVLPDPCKLREKPRSPSSRMSPIQKTQWQHDAWL